MFSRNQFQSDSHRAWNEERILEVFGMQMTGIRFWIFIQTKKSSPVVLLPYTRTVKQNKHLNADF